MPNGRKKNCQNAFAEKLKTSRRRKCVNYVFTPYSNKRSYDTTQNDLRGHIKAGKFSAVSQKAGFPCIGFIMGRVTNGLNAFRILVQIENDELHLNKRQIPAFPRHMMAVSPFFVAFPFLVISPDDIGEIYRNCIV